MIAHPEFLVGGLVFGGFFWSVGWFWQRNRSTMQRYLRERRSDLGRGGDLSTPGHEVPVPAFAAWACGRPLGRDAVWSPQVLLQVTGFVELILGVWGAFAPVPGAGVVYPVIWVAGFLPWRAIGWLERRHPSTLEELRQP